MSYILSTMLTYDTQLQYCLDEWKTGYRLGGRNGIKFTERAYAPVYQAHHHLLREWVVYTTEVSEDNEALCCQKELLREALCVSIPLLRLKLTQTFSQVACRYHCHRERRGKQDTP